MLKKNNIVIFAPKNVGKSSTAKELSLISKIPSFDSDALIIEYLLQNYSKQYKTVAEFFTAEGKASFMQIESMVIQQLLTQQEEFILATGGGIADNSVALGYLENTYKVFLLADAESICQRVFLHAVPAFVQVGAQEEFASLLAGLSNEELLQKYREYFIRTFNQRNKIYQSIADLTLAVESKSTQQIAKQICDTI